MWGVVERGRPLRRFLGRLIHLDEISVDFPQEAESLRRAGDLDRAAWVCARGVKRFPDYASGHVVMGEILREQGALELAAREWREALRCHPEHPRAHLRLAQLHLVRGEIAQAMTELELSLLYSPNSPEAHALLDRARASDEVDDVAHRSEASRKARQEALLAAARRCSPLTTMVGQGGVVLGGELYARQKEAGAGTLACTLMLESRLLMERVGAGALRSVWMTGTGGNLHCHELDGAALVAVMWEQGTGKAELDRAVAALREDKGAEGAVQ
jgi:tetratricopeptide (TPR) repeat protein